MEHILLVIQMMVALFLIGCVLLQRSDSDGMGGLGASGGSGLFSSRGQANLMTRTTAILAAIFMLNSLLLGIITARSGATSLVDDVVASQPAVIEAPKDGVPATPESTPTPVIETPKDIVPTPASPETSKDQTPKDVTPETDVPAVTAPTMSTPNAPAEAPKAE